MTDQPVTDQPETPVVDPLLMAMRLLTQSVTVLSDNLDVSDRMNRRGRTLMVLVACIVLVGGTIGTIQWFRVSRALEHSNTAIAGNTEAAVQSCENANGTRAANLALWQYALSLQTGGTPAQQTLVSQFSAWVAVLYQPHDCNDLNRVYCIPPPPNGAVVAAPAAGTKDCTAS